MFILSYDLSLLMLALISWLTEAVSAKVLHGKVSPLSILSSSEASRRAQPTPVREGGPPPPVGGGGTYIKSVEFFCQGERPLLPIIYFFSYLFILVWTL